jgi:hypothetical protein
MPRYWWVGSGRPAPLPSAVGSVNAAAAGMTPVREGTELAELNYR